MRPIDWLITELRVTGGAEVFVRRVAPALIKIGWPVRVITIASGGNLVKELRDEGVPVIELGLRNHFDAAAVWRLVDIWRRKPPALVHTHLYHAGILGRSVAHLLGVRPVVVHQHGAEKNRSWLRTLLDRITAPWVDQYVATCQAVAKVLGDREGVSSDCITVIYNGISFDKPETPLFPPDWPAPAGLKVIGCVGRLSYEKGQDVLLAAFSHLRKAGVQSHIVFIGDGHDAEALVRASVSLGIQDHVSFVGLRHDVTDWLPHFDLFVLPSRWEGVSIALLEAMAAGLPVVATAVGGTPEVVLDRQTGLLVPPGDVVALAEAIAILLRDPDLRRQIGQNGRTSVMRHYSLDETVRQTAMLYESLLATRGAD